LYPSLLVISVIVVSCNSALSHLALFDRQSGFWKDPEAAIREAYLTTDGTILEKAPDLGPGGSTAVTAILINNKRLLVANVGDSRAVLSQDGVAQQLSIDHEPGAPSEKGKIEKMGGFVSNMPGTLPIDTLQN
jgi:protein phosphatase 1L